MCIAVPGQLIERSGRQGRVDINGNILNVDLGVVAAQAGDYVLVHAGCAISILNKQEKEEMDELFTLLSEVDDDHA